MTVLNKDQILGAADIQYREVPVPEWGGSVRLRSMTGADRDDYEQWLISLQGDDKVARSMSNVRARMASLSIVDEAGERIFSFDDVAALGKKSAAALGRVYDEVVALNAIAASDIEGLAKN